MGLMIALGAAYASWRPAETSAQGATLLEGRVTSSGAAVAGIPVRARKSGGSFAVSVYTSANGQYSFPDWSDVSAGTYTVSIAQPDFVHAAKEGVALTAGKTTKLDFLLQPKTPTVAEATESEIIAALTGTDEQKHLFIQCDNCHTLQWALRNPKTKEQWLQTITRMAGARNAISHTPGTRTYQQKQYIEPLADYLASIRGPGSSNEIPFKLRPRPTSPASTRLVVTEYDIPRGGQHELYMIRGDRRFAWPHDVLVDNDSKGPFVWYTDHFSNTIGRVNTKTGEAKEFAYTVKEGMGREGEMAQMAPGQDRAGNPGGGGHGIVFDREGRVTTGVSGGTVRFDRSTEKFTVLDGGSTEFGLDPVGNVRYSIDDKGIVAINVTSGERTLIPLTPGGMEVDDATYGKETDAQGRGIFNLWKLGKMGVFDPKTGKFTEYPVATPGSGPRRGEMDANNNAWLGLYWAGRVARFNPNTGEVREFPLFPDHKAYTAPFPSPYTASVDDKNQIVWANDFNSGRIFSIDMKTGQSTEHFMPRPYELRDLATDESAERPTVWIPSYRPPSMVVRVQLR
ncbi:MAG: carboxypeptidase regulatory-like domain-containing protein [Terriglobia bacterium]